MSDTERRCVDLHGQIYPKIHRALMEILVDNGGLNRVECPTGRPQFTVPVSWVPGLPAVENALTRLSAEDFSTFCTGEHDDMNEIAARSKRLQLAHYFMEDYFSEWGFMDWEVAGFLMSAASEQGKGDA